MRLVLTSLLILATASAQSVQVLVPETARHGDIVTNQSGLVLPAGEFTIAEMIDSVAGYLCRNYLYDPSTVMQSESIVLQRSIALDATGSEEVLYALLASRNLAALPLDELRGIYQIVSLQPKHHTLPMAMIPWRRPQDLLRRPNFRELVMTSVTLDNLHAPQVANALRNHFAMMRTWQPGAPTVSSLGPRTLMLHGYGDQVTQLILALRDIDRLVAPTPPVSANGQLLKRLEALELEVRRLRTQLGR